MILDLHLRYYITTKTTQGTDKFFKFFEQQWKK